MNLPMTAALILLLLFQSGPSPESRRMLERMQDAGAFASEWLRLIDDGRVDAAWNRTSPFFRSKIERPLFFGEVAELNAFQKEHGEIDPFRQRTRANVSERRPEGFETAGYWAFLFRTRTRDGTILFQTVIVQADKDGRWEIAGYHRK
jgi:hypothetical protein